MRRLAAILTLVGLFMVFYGSVANLPTKMDGPDPNAIWFNSGLGVLGLAGVIAAALIVRWLRTTRHP